MKNIVVISDIHAGCKFALCPPKISLDYAGYYSASKFQLILYKKWCEFWRVWVPLITKGDDYVLVINGDAVDGTHHGSKTQISQNYADQANIFETLMKIPLADNHLKAIYFIRGTEAHVGKSAEQEEQIAKRINAIPDNEGNYSRYDLWFELGEKKSLIHFSHHVAATSSAAYESTAVFKELVEAYNEAGRWNERPPDCIIRSHRHRAMIINIPASNGMAYSAVTPGWQLKTPFVWKMGLGRSSQPQIGGLVIRENTAGYLYVASRTWTLKRSKTENYEQ